MSYEEDLNRLKEEVEKAAQYISAKHADANREEARKLLSNAGEALKADKIDEAIELAKKAQLAAMSIAQREGIIRAKLEQGREKMQAADQLFKNVKYYDAKEGYKAAREYLEKVQEEASNYKFSELVEELNNLIHVCNQNMAAATTVLTDVGGVGPEIIPVDRVGKGLGGFREIAIKQPELVTPIVKKLMEKYMDLIYLGGGGFADVYKGKKKDGNVVAVKVPRNLDEKAEDIFFREIRMWEKLNHRNVAKLISPYLRPEPHIEIEYADGGSLHDVLKSGPFDVKKACRVAFDIASGLGYAHSKHVIHGDINPRNVLLNSMGEAKIADFGLSKIATSSSEVKGYTLAYASKEQVEKSKSNEKTDSYQLGLTLYVMLSGSNPFDAGSRVETEERIKNFTPKPPSEFNHGCSGLDDIVMRCLSKKPGERPLPGEFREFIYEFVKRNYDESLHLTEDIRKIISLTCGHAMMAAKKEDIAECLRTLNYAKGKVRDPDIRKEMKSLIEQVEFRAKNEISLNQLLDKMEIFLKKVEWEG